MGVRSDYFSFIRRIAGVRSDYFLAGPRSAYVWFHFDFSLVCSRRALVRAAESSLPTIWSRSREELWKTTYSTQVTSFFVCQMLRYWLGIRRLVLCCTWHVILNFACSSWSEEHRLCMFCASCISLHYVLHSLCIEPWDTVEKVFKSVRLRWGVGCVAMVFHVSCRFIGLPKRAFSAFCSAWRLCGVGRSQTIESVSRIHVLRLLSEFCVVSFGQRRLKNVKRRQLVISIRSKKSHVCERFSCFSGWLGPARVGLALGSVPCVQIQSVKRFFLGVFACKSRLIVIRMFSMSFHICREELFSWKR